MSQVTRVVGTSGTYTTLEDALTTDNNDGDVYEVTGNTTETTPVSCTNTGVVVFSSGTQYYMEGNQLVTIASGKELTFRNLKIPRVRNEGGTFSAIECEVGYDSSAAQIGVILKADAGNSTTNITRCSAYTTSSTALFQATNDGAGTHVVNIKECIFSPNIYLMFIDARGTYNITDCFVYKAAFAAGDGGILVGASAVTPTVNIKNCVLSSNGAASGNGTVTINTAGNTNVVIDGCFIHNSNQGHAVVVSNVGSGGSVQILNSHLHGVQGGLDIEDLGQNVLTVRNCIFTGTGATYYDITGDSVNNDAGNYLTISNCMFYSPAHADYTDDTSVAAKLAAATIRQGIDPKMHDATNSKFYLRSNSPAAFGAYARGSKKVVGRTAISSPVGIRRQQSVNQTIGPWALTTKNQYGTYSRYGGY